MIVLLRRRRPTRSATRGVVLVRALAAMVLACIALPEVCVSQQAVTYNTPPKCLVWLEGEDCTDHNWVEGPAFGCWAFDACGVHGGVLDLAAWHLPPDGRYYARFPFELPEPGEYVLYYLGRVPNMLSSPIEWSVDEQPPVEIAADGWNIPGLLNVHKWYKYALIRLGTFAADAGPHSLTVTVRKQGFDFIHNLYSAQIDALGIAPASWPVEAHEPPIRAHSEAPNDAQPTPTLTRDDESFDAVSLIADDLSATISPLNGGIRELAFLCPARVRIAHAPEVASPLSVEFLDGVTTDAGPVQDVETQGDRVVLRTTTPRLRCELTYERAGQSQVRFTAQITNRSEVPICRVRLAPLSAIAVAGDASDDTWRVAQDVYSPDRMAGSHRTISPHTFSFDWVCFGDDTLTAYEFLTDRALLDTEAEFGRGAEPGQAAHLALSKFPRIKPGGSWVSPPLVMGAYAGPDWRPAADRFSEWWYSWARSPQIPEWMKRMGGMTLGWGVHGDDVLGAIPDSVLGTQSATGVAAYHGAGWISGNTECWYPVQYSLDPDQLHQLRAVTDAYRSAGGRTSMYTNGLMFSRACPQFELWGRDLAAVDSDGRIRLTEHHTHHHPMALPYPNERWGAHFAAIVEPAVLQGRPDMLYIDQLGAVPAHLDFAPDRHMHEHYGEWTAGSARFLDTVCERLRSRNPELVVYTECPCPALLQYTQLSMYGTTPILRYVFPTYYGFVGPYASVDADKAAQLTQEAFLTGQPVLLCDAKLSDADETARERVRRLVEFKQAVDPLLYEARYRETVGLTTPPTVRASTFVSTGRVLVPFVQDGEPLPRKITVDPARLGVSLSGVATIRTVDGAVETRPLRVSSREDGSVEFALPGCWAGLVELN